MMGEDNWLTDYRIVRMLTEREARLLPSKSTKILFLFCFSPNGTGRCFCSLSLPSPFRRHVLHPVRSLILTAYVWQRIDFRQRKLLIKPAVGLHVNLFNKTLVGAVPLTICLARWRFPDRYIRSGRERRGFVIDTAKLTGKRIRYCFAPRNLTRLDPLISTLYSFECNDWYTMNESSVCYRNGVTDFKTSLGILLNHNRFTE